MFVHKLLKQFDLPNGQGGDGLIGLVGCGKLFGLEMSGLPLTTQHSDLVGESTAHLGPSLPVAVHKSHIYSVNAKHYISIFAVFISTV